jgi:hypothetical protein
MSVPEKQQLNVRVYPHVHQEIDKLLEEYSKHFGFQINKNDVIALAVKKLYKEVTENGNY